MGNYFHRKHALNKPTFFRNEVKGKVTSCLAKPTSACTTAQLDAMKANVVTAEATITKWCKAGKYALDSVWATPGPRDVTIRPAAYFQNCMQSGLFC